MTAGKGSRNRSANRAYWESSYWESGRSSTRVKCKSDKKKCKCLSCRSLEAGLPEGLLKEDGK